MTIYIKTEYKDGEYYYLHFQEGKIWPIKCTPANNDKVVNRAIERGYHYIYNNGILPLYHPYSFCDYILSKTE